MVAILPSNVVLIGVVAGIPALAILLVILWALPGRRALAGGATIVAVVLAGLAMWAVFRPSGPSAVASAPIPSLPPASAPASGPPPQGPSGSCTPSGTEVHVVAKALAFNPTCLAAPVGQSFTIAFDNEDPSIPHNVHILESDPATNPSAASLFAGALVTGPKTETYQVNALPAGKYYFQCDVHPSQMRGTFVVA